MSTYCMFSFMFLVCTENLLLAAQVLCDVIHFFMRVREMKALTQDCKHKSHLTLVPLTIFMAHIFPFLIGSYFRRQMKINAIH